MSVLKDYKKGAKVKTKVYTVAQESMYLVIRNIPPLSLLEETENVFQEYGKIDEIKFYDEDALFYDGTNKNKTNSQNQDQDQNEVAKLLNSNSIDYAGSDSILIKFSNIQNARFAKKRMQRKNLFGRIIKIKYMPALETVEETILKLQQRDSQVQSQLSKLNQKHLQPLQAPNKNKRNIQFHSYNIRQKRKCTNNEKENPTHQKTSFNMNDYIPTVAKRKHKIEL